MEILLVLAVVAIAALVIAGPLRSARRSADGAREQGNSGDRDDLAAAKEAKYREIRDAELDYRTGKLSREDWQRLDSALRAEAVELLDRLDALERRGQRG